MKLRALLLAGVALSAFSLTLFSTPAQAATSRKGPLITEIYNYNHPFNTNSFFAGELSTKMSKMALNAFSFYRGTAHLYYIDIKNALLPASIYTNAATNKTWIEGDMHMQNMGGLRDANGNAVFDTNDFDEGYWGSYTWDLRRMAVAILLAAEENGISSADRSTLVKNFIDSYATQIAAFKGVDTELNYRLDISNTNGVVKDTIQAADAKKRSDLLAKYTIVSSGNRYFQSIANSLQPVNSSTFTALNNAMSAYINSIPTSKRKSNGYYQLKDAALRLGSGTGSLGRYRYYLLIAGDSSTDNTDDVILEMKQESDSAVSIAAPANMPASFYNNDNSIRATKSMKAMLSNTDIFAGYTTMNSLPFFIRERSPYQEDFDYTLLTTYAKFNDAINYMGKIVAKNHALADKDYDATIVYSMDKEITDVINGDISGLKTETLNYALNYAAQVKQDYADFIAAKNSGAVLY